MYTHMLPCSACDRPASRWLLIEHGIPVIAYMTGRVRVKELQSEVIAPSAIAPLLLLRKPLPHAWLKHLRSVLAPHMPCLAAVCANGRYICERLCTWLLLPPWWCMLLPWLQLLHCEDCCLLRCSLHSVRKLRLVRQALRRVALRRDLV
jgi:hypothetical protein